MIIADKYWDKSAKIGNIFIFRSWKSKKSVLDEVIAEKCLHKSAKIGNIFILRSLKVFGLPKMNCLF